MVIEVQLLFKNLGSHTTVQLLLGSYRAKGWMRNESCLDKDPTLNECGSTVLNAKESTKGNVTDKSEAFSIVCTT